MSITASAHADVLWFLPTHGDGRYLGTTFGARPVDSATCGRSRRRPTISAISACCCRPAEAAKIHG